jgi:uncharacterized metal-binding protein YceD (DUF177 family)
MKIEFRKVPFTSKKFTTSFDSVKLEGTFCKISPLLIKLQANLSGQTGVECCRCGDEDTISVDENLEFLLSDGIFNDADSEELVIEIENHTIDFDEIIQSELSSIKSDYHICEKCSLNDSINKEF